MIKLEDSTTEELTRYYFYKIHIQIAATLHRNAAETVVEMMERIPKLDLDPQVKLVELLIAVGLNNREEAVKDANWKDAKMVLGPPYESIAYCPGFSQKTPGQKSVKIKLESNGSYDIEALKAAFAAGKKVKLVICE